MLNKIVIKDVFAHKNTTINFETGLSRIHGANEAGKSQVFEMIRWALFGNKALRTAAEDYKGGSVELTFLKDYRVVRTAGNAVLHKDGEVIARSTAAVNKKIIELIGYGLKTFDNVNSINQSEVEKLTSMSLTDRKKFLDELIGAAEIDKLIADYKAEASSYDAEVKALSGLITTVTHPEMPEGLRPLEIIDRDQKALDVKVTEIRVQEKAVEMVEQMVKNTIILNDPMPNHSKADVEKLLKEGEEVEEARTIAIRNNPSIARLVDAGAGYIDVPSLAADVELVLAARNQPRPRFTPMEVEEIKRKHKEQEAFEKVQQLRLELETYQSCPRCGLSFENEAAEVTEKINQLLPIARPHKGLASKEAVAESEEALRLLNEATDRMRSITSPYAQMFDRPVDFDQPTYDIVSSAIQQGGYNLKELRASLDVKTKMEARADLEKRLEEEKNKLSLLDVTGTVAQITTLRQERADRDQYDVAVKHYNDQKDRNAELETKIAERTASKEENAAVVKALQGFKYYINTYFLPSVGKAASAMLVTMTNGKRKKISITDKFEIDVDGRKVEALSGSTKAIVNIALRFALQFVLTKNAFSVFMADEVDGSFDDNRAKYLNECMVGMTDHISQVIVISHKPITAQHDIKL